MDRYPSGQREKLDSLRKRSHVCCVMGRNKENYNRYMREYMLRRYYKRRSQAFGRLGNCCAECGGRDGLEIDHVDPSHKSFSIPKMWNTREDIFWAEVEKCQLLCHRHHVEKTIRDRGFNSKDQHGTLACYRGSRCRCPACVKVNSDYCKEYRRRKKDQ